MMSIKHFKNSINLNLVVIILLILYLSGLLSNLKAQSPATPLIRNKLHVKAILKDKDTPIYESPATSSSVLLKANQFSFVFVFEPATASSTAQNYFYYVGKEPTKALGWIQKSKARLWDHRECLKFTPLFDRLPAKVYASYNDLKSAMGLGNISSIQAIAEEPGNTANVQYAMLLPILSRQVLGAGNSAFEIAFLSANPTSSRPNPATHQDPNKEVNYLDILFLLDTTLSMSPYIGATKEIIDRIANKAINMREGGVKIGLRCYRDHGDREYVTREFSSLTTNFSKVNAVLQNQVSTGENTIGIPEAVFDGLFAGITESRWSTGSGLRVIILVGDASSHLVGDPNNPHNYTVEQILETASEKQNRVRIIALKIASKYEDDNKIHEQQLQKLANGLTSADAGWFIKINIDNPTQVYIERVATAVEVEIDRLLRLIDVSTGIIQPVTIEREERAIIFKNIVPKAGLSIPEYSSGWIAEKNSNGKLQLKPYVFMSREDMVLTLFYLEVALTYTSTPSETIKNAMIQNIAAQTGEQLQPGQTLQDHYEKRLGLPLRSRMLAFTLEDILSWSDDRRSQLIDYIKNQKKLLEEHKGDPSLWFTTTGSFTYTFVPLDYFP